MIKKANYFIFMFVIGMNAVGQEIPTIKFNHLSFTIEYEDLKALRESSFVIDTLGVLETRTTKVDSLITTKTNFLYGQSNYLELFESSSNDPNLGFSTIVFSVDKINGLKELIGFLDNTYQTGINTRVRNLDGVNIPWYDALTVIDNSIIDSTYISKAHFWFWIMEYKAEYFEYKNYSIKDNELTRENYLENYGPERENKIIKTFSGIVMKLNPEEKEYFTRFLSIINYSRVNENEYLSPDNFTFQIKERQPGDQNSIESIRFETSKEFLGKKTVKISDNIFITIQGRQGQMVFK